MMSTAFKCGWKNYRFPLNEEYRKMNIWTHIDEEIFSGISVTYSLTLNWMKKWMMNIISFSSFKYKKKKQKNQ